MVLLKGETLRLQMDDSTVRDVEMSPGRVVGNTGWSPSPKKVDVLHTIIEFIHAFLFLHNNKRVVTILLQNALIYPECKAFSQCPRRYLHDTAKFIYLPTF